MVDSILDSLLKDFPSNSEKSSVDMELRQLALEPELSEQALETIAKIIYCLDLEESDFELHQIWTDADLTLQEKFNHFINLLNSRLEANKEFILKAIGIFNQIVLPALNSKLKDNNLETIAELDSSRLLLFAGNEIPYGNAEPIYLLNRRLKPLISISATKLQKQQLEFALEIFLHEALHFAGFLNNNNFQRIGTATRGIDLLVDLLEFVTVTWTYITKHEIKEIDNNRDGAALLSGVWDNIYIDGGYADTERTLKKICYLLGIDESVILTAAITQDPIVILSEINLHISKLDDSSYEDFIQSLYLDFRLSCRQRDFLISNRQNSFIDIYDYLLKYAELHKNFIGRRKTIYSKEYLEGYFSQIMSIGKEAASISDIDEKEALLDRADMLAGQLINLFGTDYETYFDVITNKIKEPEIVAKIVEEKLKPNH